MSYLGAAESLRNHGAFLVPVADWSDEDSSSVLGHFPPGFSIAIAAASAAGLSSIQAARAVMVLTAALTAGLLMWWLAADAGVAAGALAVLLGLASPTLATDYVRILSEPLFIALVVLQLVLMVRRPAVPLWWGLAAAGAVLTRYSGLALVGAAALVAFVRAPGPRRRARDVALAAGPGLAAYALWSLYVRLAGGDVRSYGYYPGILGQLGEARDTLLAWLAPGITRPALQWCVAVLVLAGAAAVLARAAQRLPWLGVAALLGVAQVAMLVVSRVIADPGVIFDDRMLSPIAVLALAAVATAFVIAWRTWTPRGRIVGAALLLSWGAASAAASWRFVRTAREDGWGYASPEWRESPAGRWLTGEGRGHAIFTDNPAAVWYVAHRPLRGLPGSLAPDSVRAFADTLRVRGGVIMDWADDYDSDVDPAALARAIGLRRLAGDSLGTVWGP